MSVEKCRDRIPLSRGVTTINYRMNGVAGRAGDLLGAAPHVRARVGGT